MATLRQRLNWEFLLILLLAGLQEIPYWARAIVPAHDTLQVLQYFHFYYTEYFENGIWARWMPYFCYGTQSDFWTLVCLAPSQYVAMLAGKVLGIRDSLALFKASVALEQLALLLGLYLLSRRLFKSRLTRIVVCVGTMACTHWVTQIWWDFRVYYLLPLVLWFIIRFFDTYHFKYMWAAGLVCLVSLIGNLPYFVPLYAFVLVVFVGVMFWRRRAWEHWQWRTMLSPSAIGLFGACLVIGAAYAYAAVHATDETMMYVRGRDPVSKAASTEAFYGYATNPSPVKFLELLYAIPASPGPLGIKAPPMTGVDGTAYIGLIMLVFLIYALLQVHDDVLAGLVLVAAGLWLLSLSCLTVLAPVLYHLPLFRYFRHLGMVLPLAKLFLLIAAGFGFDRFYTMATDANRRSEFEKTLKLLLAIGGTMLVMFAVLDALHFLGKLPYRLTNLKLEQEGDFLDQFDFHYLPVGLLVAMLVVLYRRRGSATLKPGWSILALCLFELASYHFFLSVLWPIHLSEDARREFVVHPHPFQELRIDQGELFQKHRPESEIARRMGERYDMYFSAMFAAPCVSNFRNDYLPLPVDRLIRARLGVPLDDPTAKFPENVLFKQGPKPDLTDAVLDEILGCITPKLRLATNAKIVSSVAEAVPLIQHLQTTNAPPVIIQAQGQTGTAVTTSADSASAGTITVMHFDANSLDVQTVVNPPAGAWLLYSDGAHPGWRATVDGQPQQITLAYLAFKAVHLQPGAHEVQFTFVGSPALRYVFGLFRVLAVGGCILLIVMLAWLLRQNVLASPPQQAH